MKVRLDKLKLTTVLSIIGALTGTSGLAISFRDFWLSSPKLKIELDIQNSSYFFNVKDLGDTGFVTNRSAIVSVKISNASSFPITIDRIFVKKKKYFSFHSIRFSTTPREINVSPGRYTAYNVSKPLDLPLRIEPFDVIYGSVRLPFAEKLITENKMKCNITFSTSRKLKRLKVSLLEYNEFHTEQIRLS
jgi:hypothetical protein